MSKERLKKPSGAMEPTGNLGMSSPVPVVLTPQTVLKLAAWIVGPFLMTIIAILAFYLQGHYKTESHIDNKEIHLKQNEREVLETRENATKERGKIFNQLKEHINMTKREITVQQSQKMDEVSKRIMRELRRRGR